MSRSPFSHLSDLRRLCQLLLLLLLGLATSRAQEGSQQALTGKVLNQQDGKPIAGVILLIELIGEEGKPPHQLTYAQSADDGTFCLSWSETKGGGKIQLVARRLGYAAQTLPLKPPLQLPHPSPPSPGDQATCRPCAWLDDS